MSESKNATISVAIKAALLSGLVFPGAGHFYLKKHLMGLVLTICSLGATYYIFSDVFARARAISEKIQNGELPLDVAVIAEQVSLQGTQSLSTALVVLMVCWLVGIVDSLRLGYAMGRGLERKKN
ncbi:hypothetical protein MNBD_GAMMA10-2762 [hydrothermal vent metagenome]|uniref:DUF5683 domain-containing protein n=1 Tax=hydrothermal vent metagenome TaxID=652676 RepID=A0A3B0Y178_9ZZZZ